MEWIQKTVLIRRKKMKLQTQFTVPNKELKVLDNVKKVDFLEETLNKECIDYPNQEGCLVCCN